jgi:PAS domain S-box-containing protein
MLRRLRSLTAPPFFAEDEEKTRRAAVLNTLLLSAMGFLALVIVFVIPFVFFEKRYNLLAALVLLVFFSLARWLMRRGRVELAGGLFIAILWLVFTAYQLFSNGLHSPLVTAYVAGTVITGLLLGWRSAVVYALLSSLAGLGMAVLEAAGRLPDPAFPLPPLSGWVDLTLSLGMTITALYLFVRSLNSALALTRQRLEERQRVEEALRRNEEKFRRLFETSLDFLYVTDMDGHILKANKAASAMSGYSLEELKRINIGQLYYDPFERQSLRERILRDGYVDDYEIKGRRKDGSQMEALVTSSLVRDAEGTPLGFHGSIKDISGRKQIELQLRQSEERFFNLSTVTLEGVGISEHGRIVDANQQLAAMLGYPLEELLGMEVMNFVAPQSRALVRRQMKARASGPYVHLALRKDGSTFPVEVHSNETVHLGKPARVAILHDISERKRAEEAGARQLERLRALYKIEQAILSSLDLGRILNLLVWEVVRQLHVDAAAVLLLNPQTQRLEFAAGEGFRTQALRFTQLEIGSGLAGKAARKLKTVSIADLSRVRNPVLTQSISGEGFISYYAVPLIAKEELQGVLEIFHRATLAPDPEWLTVLETLAAQAALSIQNASLLEATQESLKEVNALYRISQSLTGSLDPDQLMKDVVELLHKNFGFYHVQIFLVDPAGKEMVARHGGGELGDQLRLNGYRLPLGMGIIGHVAETGQAFTTNDVDQVIFFVRNPLLPETLSEMCVPIKVEDQVLGVLDIQHTYPHRLTERQMHLMEAVADQLAVSLQKANLYAKLQHSLRQEKSMRGQLIQSERLALVGRLLASVSHELNNPIQAIQNALFLIKEEEQLSEQGRQDLEIVLSETERMAALIDRLRATYRPTHGEDFEEIQVNDLVDYVYALTATHMRHSHIAFRFEPDPDLPIISGIPEQLRQVMLNLFMNAIEAMRNGGELTVRTQRLARQKKILISFRDTGAGIDPQLLPHIFEPFVTNKENGTGLGLTITYDIIQQHHGEIQAENDPQAGAIFKVWLPVKRRG